MPNLLSWSLLYDEDSDDEVEEDVDDVDDEDVEVCLIRLLRRVRLDGGCPSICGDSWGFPMGLELIVA